MDESAINAYREALEEGSENYNHVRVMVVGYHGAGKSSLTKRLLRENVEEVRSTDGVEIFTKRGRFQLSDHAWIKFDGKQGMKPFFGFFCWYNTIYKYLKDVTFNAGDLFKKRTPRTYRMIPCKQNVHRDKRVQKYVCIKKLHKIVQVTIY